MLILRTITLCGLTLVTRLCAQEAPASAGPKEVQGTPAVLACPSANQPAPDPITFNWKAESQTATYRLLLGPTPGANRDGDTAIITSLQAQFAGLPAGQSLYVTLWSYDSSGKPVEPPSFCFIKTAPGKGVPAYQDLRQTSLTGVSLGSVAADNGTASPCQQQCNLNAACQGYTYFPAANGNAAAMCDLKSQITSTNHNECCVSALKGAMPDSATPVAVAPIAPPAAPLPPSSPADPFAARSAPVATPLATPEALAAAPVQNPPAPPAPVAPAPVAAAPGAPLPAPPAPRSAVAPAPPPAPKPIARATGVSGDWINQLGALSRLVQQGTVISGAYSDSSQPSLSGAFQGTFDGKTLRATLTWKSGDDSSHGTLLLTLTPDGRLDGTWTDANGVSGPWTMALHP